MHTTKTYNDIIYTNSTHTIQPFVSVWSCAIEIKCIRKNKKTNHNRSPGPPFWSHPNLGAARPSHIIWATAPRGFGVDKLVGKSHKVCNKNERCPTDSKKVGKSKGNLGLAVITAFLCPFNRKRKCRGLHSYLSLPANKFRFNYVYLR